MMTIEIERKERTKKKLCKERTHIFDVLLFENNSLFKCEYTMSSNEIEKLNKEKSSLIGEYLVLKKQYQELFFKYKVTSDENANLKKQIVNLQNENKELNSEIDENKKTIDVSLLQENKSLVAKISQMNRLSSPNIIQQSVKIHSTPFKESRSKKSTATKSFPVYEVDALIKHRSTARTREFLVRWKGFKPKDDTWVKEANLLCPQILEKYKKQHRL